MYGSQKGADSAMILKLDSGLERLNSKIIEANFNHPKVNLQKIQGSGAAGGFVGGCIAFLNSKL